MSGRRAHRFIHIGTGGWGGQWCFDFLPRLVREGRLEPAAAVDVSRDHLKNAVEGYGISPELCFTDARKAFDSVEADFMILVTPPDRREQYVAMAVERGLDILAEKPMANSMDECVRIYRKVTKAGRKLGVTMSHRFDQDEQSLQQLVHSQRLGELHSVVGRFTDSRGRSGGYGENLNRFADILLIQGSVHHLDILRAIARSNAKTVYARTWNPPGVPFTGDSSTFLVVEMENGVVCQYEGALANASTLNGWDYEYFRAECTEGTAVLDSRLLKVLRGGHDGECEVECLPLLERPTWTNQWLIEQFLEWREGGPAMETSIDDNMQCNALTFAAVESAHTGTAVDVQAFLRKHLEAIPA